MVGRGILQLVKTTLPVMNTHYADSSPALAATEHRERGATIDRGNKQKKASRRAVSLIIPCPPKDLLLIGYRLYPAWPCTEMHSEFCPVELSIELNSLQQAGGHRDCRRLKRLRARARAIEGPGMCHSSGLQNGCTKSVCGGRGSQIPSELDKASFIARCRCGFALHGFPLSPLNRRHHNTSRARQR